MPEAAPARARPRTARGEETHRALLDAAACAFARDGYHRTSVPDIVQRAGLGHGTFCEHFRSRRDILVEVTRQVSDPAVAAAALWPAGVGLEGTS